MQLRELEAPPASLSLAVDWSLSTGGPALHGYRYESGGRLIASHEAAVRLCDLLRLLPGGHPLRELIVARHRLALTEAGQLADLHRAAAATWAQVEGGLARHHDDVADQACRRVRRLLLQLCEANALG